MSIKAAACDFTVVHLQPKPNMQIIKVKQKKCLHPFAVNIFVLLLNDSNYQTNFMQI